MRGFSDGGIEAKRCPRCGLVKSMTEFYKDRSKADGVESICKICSCEKARRWIKNNSQRKADYNANYYQLHSKKLIARAIKYCQLHPEKCAKFQAKHRGLGFNPLNTWFPGSCQHHINDNDVVFISESIHRKLCSKNVGIHRQKILEYYGSLKNMIAGIIPYQVKHIGRKNTCHEIQI